MLPFCSSWSWKGHIAWGRARSPEVKIVYIDVLSPAFLIIIDFLAKLSKIQFWGWMEKMWKTWFLCPCNMTIWPTWKNHHQFGSSSSSSVGDVQSRVHLSWFLSPRPSWKSLGPRLHSIIAILPFSKNYFLKLNFKRFSLFFTFSCHDLLGNPLDPNPSCTQSSQFLVKNLNKILST